jgi:ribonuclease I
MNREEDNDKNKKNDTNKKNVEEKNSKNSNNGNNNNTQVNIITPGEMAIYTFTISWRPTFCTVSNLEAISPRRYVV